MQDDTSTKPIDEPWPVEGLQSVPDCPVCGSSQRTLLHDRLKDRVFFCAPGTWSLYECGDCGCAYLDPRPSPDTIYLAYREYYTHASPKNDGSDAMRFSQWLKRSMANGYRNWKYGTNLKPANPLGIPLALAFPAARQMLDQSFRNLHRPGPGERLLDVGFGSGEFLEYAKTAGWEVAGVDPDPVSVESAVQRGLNVRHGGVEAYADMAESFDVITMSHVIEHVHDPHETLKTIYRLLKPGGFLWLSTPNIQSLGHKYYGRNWRGLEPPRHLILFNWNALIEQIQKVGFNSVQKNETNPNFADLAAKSEAIARGIDPYSSSKRFRHSLKGALANFRTRFHPYQTEFITLKAYK